MCYLRMGQGSTGGPATYLRPRDIVTGTIPEPDTKPPLSDAIPGKVCFNYDINNNVGGANTFDNLIQFLHLHYFSRLA